MVDVTSSHQVSLFLMGGDPMYRSPFLPRNAFTAVDLPGDSRLHFCTFPHGHLPKGRMSPLALFLWSRDHPGCSNPRSTVFLPDLVRFTRPPLILVSLDCCCRRLFSPAPQRPLDPLAFPLTPSVVELWLLLFDRRSDIDFEACPVFVIF